MGDAVCEGPLVASNRVRAEVTVLQVMKLAVCLEQFIVQVSPFIVVAMPLVLGVLLVVTHEMGSGQP